MKKIRCCTFEIPGMDKIEKLILVSIIISTPLRDMGMLVCVGWGSGIGGKKKTYFRWKPHPGHPFVAEYRTVRTFLTVFW